MVETAIIMPYFNQKRYIEECLRTLKMAPEQFVFVAIDNGSTDGSKELITENMVSRSVIHLSLKERSISRMWNMGIEAIKAEDYIFINSDVVFYPLWISPLKRALKDHFCAQPLRFEGRGYPSQEEIAAIASTPFSVREGGINGPCFGLSKEGIEALKSDNKEKKVFDERFRLWYQDSDVLWRLNHLSRPPVDVLNAVIYHHLSKTLLSRSGWLTIIDRDKEKFIQKWGNI